MRKENRVVINWLNELEKGIKVAKEEIRNTPKNKIEDKLTEILENKELEKSSDRIQNLFNKIRR